MLTRLQVNGFKNLVGADVSFGPLTCIAGPNGVGKSNLFDAIRFLSALADQPLLEAASTVRNDAPRGGDLLSIFHRQGGSRAVEMDFEAEMVVPQSAVDHLGQEARAAITFLRYRLRLGVGDGGLEIREERLSHINLGEARDHLRFPHSRDFRKSVVKGRRTAPFISTESREGGIRILLHQDLGGDYLGGGRPRPHVAERLPRTVLSTANAGDNKTAVVARQEMQSWRLLQLEPTSLRAPDSFRAPSAISSNGAHLPAALSRLARLRVAAGLDAAHEEDADVAATVYTRVANRLANLIDGVDAIRVEADERRELLTVLLTETDGTEHEARALSDGTLRFLALATLENDPEAVGTLCLEEPENGIHPQRIPAMLQLLGALAVDPHDPTGLENPLRQVLVNTHSPAVVAQVRADDLLFALPETLWVGGAKVSRPAFRWLGGTWRAAAWPKVETVALGHVLGYLNPLEKDAPEVPPRGTVARRREMRVMDRSDLQPWLPFAP